MAEFCASHPDSISTGDCASCGRPFCERCSVEDVAAELRFCSPACLESRGRGPEPGGRPGAELIDALRRPIVTGWRLWLSQLPSLTGWIGIPIGVAFGLFRFAMVGGDWDETGRPGVYDVVVVLSVAAGAAAAGVMLSRAHTAKPGGSPWAQVATRLLPWSFVWVFVGAGVLLGTLLLVIPGIIVGIRLFWADEFALLHRHGPLSALRASMELTRGLTGRVFGFQFVLGFAEYLVLIPLIVGVLGIEALADSLPSGLLATLVLYSLVSVLAVNAYASIHAPEVVYFYGLRALRAEMADAEVQGDWVARELRARRGEKPREGLMCPTCDSPWDPADYRQDVELIRCSACGTELTRPG